MKWLFRLAARWSSSALLHTAQEKRRLERVAQEAGCSRAMAVKVASLYFKKTLED